MTINLNKTYLTKEKLFKYIEDYDVFAKYINQEIIVGKNIHSPFRTELRPSFGFFLGENNELCFHDFTLRLKGDCIKFVEILFNLTYYEALSKIAIDFGMKDDFYVKNLEPLKISLNTANLPINLNTSKEKALSKVIYKFSLGKKRRDWEPHDIIYWSDFGISLKTLKKYNVEPISHILFNNNPIKAEKYAYCFIEIKDGIETYKIYQPFSKDYKWLSTHNESVWQGWNQLPKEAQHEVLIITKSLKDVMSIDENTPYHAVALQCENVLPKKHVVEELQKRFYNIFILYDNDYDKEQNWGQIFSKALEEETGIESIKIDEEYKSKDFSDLIKNKGVKKATDILENELINPPF